MLMSPESQGSPGQGQPKSQIIKIIKNPLPELIDPEVVQIELLDLIHSRIATEEKLIIKTSWDSENERKQRLLFGYYPYYGTAYISSPENRDAIFALDMENRELIVDFTGGAFYDQRDAYVFRDFEGFEVDVNFQGFLRYITENGYSIKAFSPENLGDYIISYENATQIPRLNRVLDPEDVIIRTTEERI